MEGDRWSGSVEVWSDLDGSVTEFSELEADSCDDQISDLNLFTGSCFRCVSKETGLNRCFKQSSEGFDPGSE